MRSAVPAIRVCALNQGPLGGAEAKYVLYWMTAARRPVHSFALQRAAELAAELKLPLVVLEPLRCGYRWASPRLHRLILDGMADNARWFDRARNRRRALYYPYVEPEAGAGKGLLAGLAKQAAVVVTDEFPCFFYPAMQRAAARQLPVRLEAVDGNGLLPLRRGDRAFPTAHGFRRHLQRTLPGELMATPLADPLRRALPEPPAALARALTRRWPPATREQLERADLGRLPLDASVPVAPLRGGFAAATRRWRGFLAEGLARYGARRHHPDEDGASGLSPYLHLGQISAHQIVGELLEQQGWSIDRLEPRADGRREGWWGVDASAEGFLDQIVTWREVGFNGCFFRPDDYHRYESLPEWARRTLAEHARDPRPHRYAREQLERAETADTVWNAAQRQLLGEGRIHNYLRMLWGKKILEWSPTPRAALATMVTLNNKLALDGRDPNSYSGIFWVLGRYDRAWGPERPIYGKVRYMSSENAARKLRLRRYLERYGPTDETAARQQEGAEG